MKLEIIFVIFAIVGALDKIIGNRFKLGEEFDKGIMTAGPLIISMSGMIVLAPVLAQGLKAVFQPALSALHMDMSVLSAFFAVDAGGASMAYELSSDTAMRGYNGIVIASMFGATLCPVIPMALQMVKKTYHEDVLIGLLCGFATIPIGCLVSGLMLGIPLGVLLLDTLLIIIISGIICLGLWKCPTLSQKVFGIIGAVLTIFVTVGLAVGIVHQLLGIELIPGIAPVSESFTIIGNIAIILAGVFPLLSIISRIFNKVFLWLGKVMKLDNTSVLGLVTNLANSIPVFSMLENMNKKGRIMNMAFSVSAAYAFGDHLAFVLSFDRAFAMPMVLGKLLSGVLAAVLAAIVYKRSFGAKEETQA
ncbi:MAG: ethanolamine utilization protein EutH [Clostridia bacterium]|nr:ethanolamine utilization protein EutH [Clostridia bacterium]